MATCSGIKKVPKSLIFQAFRDELLTRIELVTSTLPTDPVKCHNTSYYSISCYVNQYVVSYRIISRPVNAYFSLQIDTK